METNLLNEQKVERSRNYHTKRQVIPVGQVRPVLAVSIEDNLAITRIRVFVREVIVKVTTLIRQLDGSVLAVEFYKPMLQYIMLLSIKPKTQSAGNSYDLVS